MDIDVFLNFLSIPYVVSKGGYEMDIGKFKFVLYIAMSCILDWFRTNDYSTDFQEEYQYNNLFCLCLFLPSR